MGIWDKSEALSYPRLTDTFDQDIPFTLLGMHLTGEVDLKNELKPTKVNVLRVRGAREKAGAWAAYGQEVDVSIISDPIRELNEAADPATDFPVVVKWTKVQPKDSTRAEATVLALVSKTVDVTA